MLESRHLVGLFVLMVVIFGVVFVLGYELGRNQYGGQVRAAAEPSDEGLPVAGKQPAAKPEVTPSAPYTPPKTAPGKKTADNSAKAAGTNTKLGPDGKPTDYDFYKLGQPNQPPPHLSAPPKNAAAQPAPNKGSIPAGKSSPANSVNPTSPKQPVPAGNSTIKNGADNSGGVKTPAPALNAPLMPKGSISLQVAALTNEGDALKMAQALQLKKFPAFVLTPTTDRFYHVQVGPYADAKTAEAARKALESAGFKPIVKH